MVHKPDERQQKCEVDQICRNHAKAGLPEWAGIPRDEIIEHQPRGLYRPPLYLAKTATRQQVAEWEGILQVLWEINEQHAGENTRLVEVYYCVSGENRPLSERIQRWCHSYFEARADPARLSPQVHKDPFLMFEKLLQEYQNLLGGLIILPRSLNYVFLSQASAYIPWLLYDRLWRDRILILDRCLVVTYEPADPDAPRRMTQYLSAHRWNKDCIGQFLARLCPCADAGDLRQIGQTSDTALRERLASLTADIQEMRRFLVRGFNPCKTVLAFGPDLVAAWAWAANSAIANLFAGKSQAEVEKAVTTRWVSLAVAINHEGLIIEPMRPWVTVEAASAVDGVRPLVLNCYALERFHEKLFSFYDQIDFDRIRLKVRSHSLEADIEEEALALSCQDLAARDAQAEVDEEAAISHEGRRVRAVRLQRLLTSLQRWFGCEVQPGKGSEVTVYRQGGKKFALGHHTQNPLVPSVVVGRLLKRLGVGLHEWLAAVYG